MDTSNQDCIIVSPLEFPDFSSQFEEKCDQTDTMYLIKLRTYYPETDEKKNQHIYLDPGEHT